MNIQNNLVIELYYNVKCYLQCYVREHKIEKIMIIHSYDMFYIMHWRYKSKFQRGALKSSSLRRLIDRTNPDI